MRLIILILFFVTVSYSIQSVPDWGMSAGFPQGGSLKFGKSIFSNSMKNGLSISIEPGILGIKQRVTVYRIISRYWCFIDKDKNGKVIYGGGEEPNFIRNTGIGLDFINSYYWINYKGLPINNKSINYGIELSLLIFKGYIEFMAPIKLSFGINVAYGKPIIKSNLFPSFSFGLSW